MSVFQRVEVACPSCKSPVPFDLVHSVNASRRPDLRVAILDRSFQRKTCTACGFAFRMEPQFTYLDTWRKQFFAVWPASKLGECEALEARAVTSFAAAFGPDSDMPELGDGMLARIVFGWAALNEKLIAAEAGIDDRTLEVAKIPLMQSLGDVQLGTDREFRLLGVDNETLVVGWLSTRSEDLDEELSAPRELLAEIEAQPSDWAALRADVVGEMFVDYRRGLLVGA